MRKIFLASTALVALGTVAGAAQAEVTFGGTADWNYETFDNASSTADSNGSLIDYDMDFDVAFTSTTDSGLSLKMAFGINEAGTMDDQYLDIAGDFGTLRLSADLGGIMGGAISESVADNMTTLSPGFAMKHDEAGADGYGNNIVYTMPTIGGLSLAAQYTDAGSGTKADQTAIMAVYAADVAGGSMTVNYGSASVDDTGASGNQSGTDGTSIGIKMAMSDFTVAASQHTFNDNANTYDYNNTIFDVSYSGIDGVKLAAYSMSGDDDLNASYDYQQSAASITYTIASGLTANLSMTDTELTNSSGTKAQDDTTVLNITAKF